MNGMQTLDVLFVNVNLFGHVNPTIALVQELCARGHRVRYLCNEKFAPQLREAGAETSHLTTTFGNRIPPDLSQFKRIDLRNIMATELLKNTRICMPQVMEEVGKRRPDLIITDTFAQAGIFAGRLAQIPVIGFSASYASTKGYSVLALQDSEQDEPSIEFLEMYETERTQFLREWSLDAGHSHEFHELMARQHIVSLPRDFQYSQHLFDESYFFMGPALRSLPNPTAQIWPPTRELPENQLNPLRCLVSLGTVFNNWPKFFDLIPEVFGDKSWSVVVSAGALAGELQRANTYEHITYLETVDQITALSQADLFISHGGMNSTMEALSYAVPLVVIPQMAEQAATARRVAELKLGVHLPKEETSSTTLSEAVGRVLEDNDLRRRIKAFQNLIERSPGASRAAVFVEDSIRSSLKEQILGPSNNLDAALC